MFGLVNLYIWTVIAMGSHGSSHADWVYAGPFHGMAACREAARNLNISDQRHRCIYAGTGGLK